MIGQNCRERARVTGQAGRRQSNKRTKHPPTPSPIYIGKHAPNPSHQTQHILIHTHTHLHAVCPRGQPELHALPPLVRGQLLQNCDVTDDGVKESLNLSIPSAQSTHTTEIPALLCVACLNPLLPQRHTRDSLTQPRFGEQVNLVPGAIHNAMVQVGGRAFFINLAALHPLEGPAGDLEQLGRP